MCHFVEVLSQGLCAFNVSLSTSKALSQINNKSIGSCSFEGEPD